MFISNHTGQTRTAGDALSRAGDALVAAAAGAAGAGEGAGGDAAPHTDAALGSLARDWKVGLAAYGRHVSALGSFADLMAAAFEALDGR